MIELASVIRPGDGIIIGQADAGVLEILRVPYSRLGAMIRAGDYLVPASRINNVKNDRMEHRSRVRYGAVAQAFHWATAILAVVAFSYGPGGSEQRVYSAAGDFDRQLHETLGLCVFALVVMRMLWRMVDTRPDPPQVPRWVGIGGKAVQWALYLLLFALPLTAITGAWLEGHPLTLLAGMEIPSPLRLSHDAGARIANLHTWLGDAILWLAGFHALAALYHHLVRKDGVLASMLPRWVPLRQSK